MQEAVPQRHSPYFALGPRECATKYQNRTLITKAVCAVLAVALMLPFLWAWTNETMGVVALVFALAVSFAAIMIECGLLSRWSLDLQGIVTLDCDPVKMYQVEALLDEQLKLKQERAVHLLIGAQAAMLMGDVKRSEHLMQCSASIKAPNRSTKLMFTAIELGCATIKKDWQTIQALLDDLNAQIPTLHGAARSAAQLQALITNEALAAARGNLQLADVLLAQCFEASSLPQQIASLTYRRAELEDLKGNYAEARACYERAAATGGTCYFARQATNWLATH